MNRSDSIRLILILSFVIGMMYLPIFLSNRNDCTRTITVNRIDSLPRRYNVWVTENNKKEIYASEIDVVKEFTIGKTYIVKTKSGDWIDCQTIYKIVKEK